MNRIVNKSIEEGKIHKKVTTKTFMTSILCHANGKISLNYNCSSNSGTAKSEVVHTSLKSMS